MCGGCLLDTLWGAGGGEWERAGILWGKSGNAEQEERVGWLYGTHALPNGKMGRDRSGQRVKGPMCPGRDLSPARTRSPFSLERVPLGYVEKGLTGEEDEETGES